MARVRLLFWCATCLIESSSGMLAYRKAGEAFITLALGRVLVCLGIHIIVWDFPLFPPSLKPASLGKIRLLLKF